MEKLSSTITDPETLPDWTLVFQRIGSCIPMGRNQGFNNAELFRFFKAMTCY